MTWNIVQNDDGSTSFKRESDDAVVILGSDLQDIMNFDSATLAADKSLIHAGSYSSPLALINTTDILVQLHAQSGGNDAGGFDYCMFTSIKGNASNDNLIGIHNTAHVPSGGDPKTVQAIQGHGYLEAGSNLATRGGDLTAGMFGAWFKIYSDVGATQDSGSLAAAIWLDNQLNGTKNGTTYSIFSSSGAASNAWAGFADDAAGWTNLFTFEGDDTPPVADGGNGDISFSGDWKKIAITINGVTYYLVASATPS